MPANGQHWTPELRASVEREIRTSGDTPTDVARRLKLNRTTVLRLAREIRDQKAPDLELPVLIWGLGHISAQGTALNGHETSIALIQQEQAALDRRMTAQETFNTRILQVVTEIANDATKTKTDVGYLRDWVEDIKRQARTP